MRCSSVISRTLFVLRVEKDGGAAKIGFLAFFPGRFPSPSFAVIARVVRACVYEVSWKLVPVGVRFSSLLV